MAHSVIGRQCKCLKLISRDVLCKFLCLGSIWGDSIKRVASGCLWEESFELLK